MYLEMPWAPHAHVHCLHKCICKHSEIEHIYLCLAGKEIAGKVSLKHIYEIAAIKSEDPCWETVPMEEICKAVIGTAHSCGIQVVRSLTSDDYAPFLEERRQIVENQELELQEARAAKLLRTGAVVV